MRYYTNILHDPIPFRAIIPTQSIQMYTYCRAPVENISTSASEDCVSRQDPRVVCPPDFGTPVSRQDLDSWQELEAVL